MCDLRERIQNFTAECGIDTTYEWNGQNADSVNIDFANWHAAMSEAMERHDTAALENIVGEIFRWGGVGSERLKKVYAQRLRDQDTSVGASSVTPLSSWSKVLAAYAPKKFFIYDSRVAIALKVLVPEYAWFLPRSRQTDGRRQLTACLRVNDRRAKTQAESYRNYLEILPEGQQLECERTLFMLGRNIDVTVAEKWLTRHGW